VKSILYPWYPFPNKAGGKFYGSARKITLHTIEAGGPGVVAWPSYSNGGTAPHVTINPGIGVRQHISFARSAYALASPGYPRSPNMNAGINIQIEIAGRSKDVANYPDWWYEALAKEIYTIAKNAGVPLVAPFPYGGDAGYGSSGAYRVSWSRFQQASGLVNHSNPPYNTHWDASYLLRRLLPLLIALDAGQTGDWLDMATEAEVKKAVAEAVAQELQRWEQDPFNRTNYDRLKRVEGTVDRIRETQGVQFSRLRKIYRAIVEIPHGFMPPGSDSPTSDPVDPGYEGR
jgi:hypothetical protein